MTIRAPGMELKPTERSCRSETQPAGFKLQEKADDLRREQEKLDKKVEELRAESNALQEHNTKALAEISFLERSIPTLRVALGEAASRKENLTAQKEELDARLEETEGKIHELSHAVELLEQTELPAKPKRSQT